jgi:hypothetical protein
MPTFIYLFLVITGDATVQERMIAAGRELLGVPYEFGGRMRKPGEGIDCQGLVQYAAERVGECGWKSFDTKPTRSVKFGELGERVNGLDPVASSALEISELEAGDVIRMVDFVENPKEPAIGKLGGEPVWVWHVTLYTGNGKILSGDYFAGEVIETDLAEYLAENREDFAGIFVTRLTGPPSPRRCRKHPPMGPYRP